MMKNQLADLMKQAQAMQDNMKKAQEAIAAMEVEGEAGAGMVKVVMTGRHDVRRVTIDPSLLGEDKDMLEDLVAAAVNDAVRKVEVASQEKMAGLTAGLPLPPSFWSGAEASAPRPGDFFYAEIPRDVAPETVLDRLATLRGR